MRRILGGYAGCDDATGGIIGGVMLSIEADVADGNNANRLRKSAISADDDGGWWSYLTGYKAGYKAYKACLMPTG
jgi:hypothetical protein